MPQQQFESEKRYDEETVQKILAAAGRLQQEHRETLSAEQVEAIGQEVGLDPVFIRKVLAQMETQEETVVAAPVVQEAAAQQQAGPPVWAIATLSMLLLMMGLLVMRMQAVRPAPWLMMWLILCGVIGLVVLKRRVLGNRTERRARRRLR